MLISLLDVKFFSLKMLSNYFTEMFFYPLRKGQEKRKNPGMEALRKTVAMLRCVLGTLLSCEVPDNVQLRSPPRCEGGLARSFFLLLIWGNFLEIPIPQHGGLDHSRSMASKTEGKNLWSLPSSSGKDKSQSFPTAMKVAEAMVQHKVVGKNYRASPASTRLFFFGFFFPLLPERSSTNVTSDVEFVLRVDIGYTANKEKRESNPIFLKWFNFSFLFPKP